MNELHIGKDIAFLRLLSARIAGQPVGASKDFPFTI